MDIELKNHPPVTEGSGLFRTVIVVEVLSDRDIKGLTLTDIAHEIVDGESASGRYETLDCRQISKPDMARALQDQSSDPDYLVENGWVYLLHAGDEVTWNDPDDGACTKTFKIRSISFENDEVIEITTDAGDDLECLAGELS